MKHPKKMTETLEHDLAWGQAILKGEGRLVPMFVMHHNDGSMTPFLSGFRDDEHKRSIYHFYSILVMAKECRAFSFMCEGWLKQASTLPGESKAASIKRAMAGPSPSEAEDRKEVLTCMLVYRDEAEERRTLSTLAEIDRGWDGVIKGFRPIEISGAAIEGSVVEIMPEEPPTLDHVMQASKFCIAKADFIMDALGISTPAEGEI